MMSKIAKENPIMRWVVAPVALLLLAPFSSAADKISRRRPSRSMSCGSNWKKFSKTPRLPVYPTSKAFASLSILMLANQGKLSLDNRVHKAGPGSVVWAWGHPS